MEMSHAGWWHSLQNGWFQSEYKWVVQIPLIPSRKYEWMVSAHDFAYWTLSPRNRFQSFKSKSLLPWFHFSTPNQSLSRASFYWRVKTFATHGTCMWLDNLTSSSWHSFFSRNWKHVWDLKAAWLAIWTSRWREAWWKNFSQKFLMDCKGFFTEIPICNGLSG